MRNRLLVNALALAAAALSLLSYSQSTNEMAPLALDHRRALHSHSPLDVSFLPDAPAGRHGFIRVPNGRLATADGERIRFWGVNISDWSKGSRQIPPKQDAPLWAATLACFGVNLVRLQFLDLLAPRGLIAGGRQDTGSLDAEQLDREDLFISELEKRGIYFDFNLLVGRPFKPGDGIEDAKLVHMD